MNRSSPWLHCLVGCALLGGITVDRRLLHPPFRNADDYHRRVLAAASAMPLHFKNWVSMDIPIPPGTVAILHPNVAISRRYQNLSSGLQATFLLVQCRDARDLVGHYPPICYPAQGYQMLNHAPDPRVLGSMKLEGTTYEFSSTKAAGKTSMKIFDVMILPDGRTAPDMEGVNSIARDRRQRNFGAAQMQILTDSAMSEADRAEVIDTVLGSAQPIIDQIRAGVIQ